MRRLTNGLLLLAAMFLVGTVAACGQSSGGGALSGLSPGGSGLSRSAKPADSGQPSATPSTATPASATPTRTTAAPTATATISSPPSTKVTAPAKTPHPSVSTPAATGSGSSSTDVWLWVLLGAVVVLGAVGWIVVAARHRTAASTASATWRSRIIDAYASGAALHDAMSVAEAPGALVGADADARWFDIQRRANDLTQTLYGLREAAPDDLQRARVADVLATLQAVRSAMDAERAPMGAGEEQAEVIRGRLFNFEASLRALRPSDNQRP